MYKLSLGPQAFGQKRASTMLHQLQLSWCSRLASRVSDLEHPPVKVEPDVFSCPHSLRVFIRPGPLSLLRGQVIWGNPSRLSPPGPSRAGRRVDRLDRHDEPSVTKGWAVVSRCLFPITKFTGWRGASASSSSRYVAILALATKFALGQACANLPQMRLGFNV